MWSQFLQHIRVEIDATDDNRAVVDHDWQRGVVGDLDKEIDNCGGVLRPVEDGGHEHQDVIGAALVRGDGLVDHVSCAAGPAALGDGKVSPPICVSNFASQLDYLTPLRRS